MPIYEYKCAACQHEFEVIQKVSDAPIKKCPQCNKAKVSKIVSAPSFQLKGSGWYVTDFRDKGKEKKQDKPEDKSDKTQGAKKADDKNKTEKKTAGTSGEKA